MVRSVPDNSDHGARLSFWLLSGLLVALWFIGGASRGDVLAQPMIRFLCWTLLIVFVLASPRFEWRRARPIALLLSGSVLLVVLQLIPLPPAVWASLPGRELFLGAAEVSGQVQPWRPISLSPGGTINALGSLVVPICVLVLGVNLTMEQHWRIAGLLLAMVFAGSLLAIMQFAGAHFDNPTINYQPGSVTGNFANRNHFALFVALGCLIAPIWGFRRSGRGQQWKAAVGLGLLPFFLMVILATGSRAGVILGVGAILAGLLVARREISAAVRGWPRARFFAVVGFSLAALAAAVLLPFLLDRAAALDRMLEMNVVDDLRSQALPYVVEAVLRYFPVGTGFGTFDPVYRIGEPDALLQTSYFNHAHNDWIEVVLEGGLPGALLLLAALGWAGLAARAMLGRRGEGIALAQVGMVALLLMLFASISDYPARTPMWMAIVVIAALWLHLGSRWKTSTTAGAQP